MLMGGMMGSECLVLHIKSPDDLGEEAWHGDEHGMYAGRKEAEGGR